jgi:hypothetical protein
MKGPLLLPFFSLFLVLGAVADPESRANAVDLANTHAQVKTLSQSRLDD